MKSEYFNWFDDMRNILGFSDCYDLICKIGALVCNIVAWNMLSLYRMPKSGATWTWLPRFCYVQLGSIFGTDIVRHHSGTLAGVIAGVILFALLIRGVLGNIRKIRLLGIFIILADVLVLTSVVDIVMGDTTKFLQGGLTTIIAVAAFTACVIGMKLYALVGLAVLFALCTANIISADKLLVHHGCYAVILLFASFFMQSQEFLANLNRYLFGDLRKDAFSIGWK